MKKINSIKLLIAGSLVVLTAFNSCKKDDDNSTTPVATTGSLMFHLHTMADTTEIDAYGDTIFLSSGRQIAVTSAQLYISNIKLIASDGTLVNGPSTTIFMKQGTEEYDLGTVTTGNYKTVKFDIGLSPTANAATPATTDATFYQSSMWFGATAQPDGFVFVNFAGSIDTTTAANGTNLIPFNYKIGTNAHLVTVTMPNQAYTITANQQTAIHMGVDYAKLLDGIPLNVSSNLNISTTAQNSSAIANQIAANMAGMVDYE